MKEQNDIDQFFESKLNKQTFELKDAYLADFEAQLDVYNKKKRGYVWFIFGALIAFTALYDFVLLPNQTNELTYKVEELKETNFNIPINNNTGTVNNFKASKITDQLQNLENGIEPTNTTKSLVEKPSSLVKEETKIEQNKTNNQAKETENVTTILETKTIDSNVNLPSIPSSLEKKIKTPTVYLDDTIRRKVVIIDTIVQRDTVVISDTIKNSMRLFKKKK